MKRIERNPAKFETLELYRAVAAREGYLFSDPASSRTFIEKLSAEFEKAKANPIVLHGLHAQSMFEYVVASLGNCLVIKSEDTGEIYINDDEINIGIPDFRILLQDHTEFFVEVKNHHPKNPTHPYKLKRKQFDGLKRYADLFKKELKIAIFWSGWNIWTLVSHHRFIQEGSKYVIGLTDAITYNEMSLFGDYHIATTPPIILRMAADPNEMRNIHPSGHAFFKIANVEMSCAGETLEEETERAIAFWLMNYGKWAVEGEVEQDGELLVAISYVAAPLEPTSGQEFQFIGSLSESVSREYEHMTAPEGTVERISPIAQEVVKRVQIHPDYQGKNLKLWRFFLQAKSDSSH